MVYVVDVCKECKAQVVGAEQVQYLHSNGMIIDRTNDNNDMTRDS